MGISEVAQRSLQTSFDHTLNNIWQNYVAAKSDKFKPI